MISVGANIMSASEPLRKVQMEYLYNAIVHPKPELSSKIDRLRIVRQLSTEQYSLLKRQLPFFVCASFNPPFRKVENFAYTEYFVIDIDHIGEKGLAIGELKFKICADPRTLLCFQSPSQDGLKVIMKFKDRCYDPGIYTVFYKKFLHDYSLYYGIQQVIDSRTSDVTRACFMSVDKEAYYNPEADLIDMSLFIPITDASEMLKLKKEVEVSLPDVVKERNPEPGDEALSRIRELLNLRSKNKTHEKEVFVPQELDDIINKVTTSVNEMGMEVYEVINIQYGKKVRARVSSKKAEVNIFYGKKGFSVVLSPRTGTDAELNQLLANAISLQLEI